MEFFFFSNVVHLGSKTRKILSHRTATHFYRWLWPLSREYFITKYIKEAVAKDSRSFFLLGIINDSSQRGKVVG
jgi:hypothetical protein